MAPRRRTVQDILLQITIQEPTTLPSGCWEVPFRCNQKGYAQVFLDGRLRTNHRLIYETLRGEIPAGLTLDYLCRHPWCCNPDHLEPVTNKVNILRGNCPPARNAIVNCCPSGHPYTGDNLYVNPKGWRTCRACNRDKSRRRRQKAGS